MNYKFLVWSLLQNPVICSIDYACSSDQNKTGCFRFAETLVSSFQENHVEHYTTKFTFLSNLIVRLK